MSYLARLKQLEIFHLTPGHEPTEPTKPPFDGFDGSAPGARENIFAGNDADEIARALIERLAMAWICPPGEFDELLNLHREGKLTLDYIKVLIADAPPK